MSAIAPVVSVVIPAYNAERWIVETIRSVQAQTYRNLEIVVVDDGSPDNLVKLVRGMAKEDTRIRLVRKENGGLPAARNTGILQATGQYIAPLDADDLWHPEKIEKQLLCLEASDESFGLVYCYSQAISETGRKLRVGLSGEMPAGDVYEKLFYTNFLSNGSSPLFLKSLAMEVGLYCEDLRLGCEDWEFYLRLAAKCKFGAVHEALVFYRQHADSMSSDLLRMVRGYDAMIANLKGSQAPTHPKLVRQSRQRFLASLATRSRLGSRDFFKGLLEVHRQDALFCLRWETWKYLLQMVENFFRRLQIRIRNPQ